jgi:uncharacterized protein YjbJ (UPF0337 family)
MKDTIKGKVRELKGRLTGDRSEEMRGKAEQQADKMRRGARDMRDDAKGGTDRDTTRPDDVGQRRSW